MKNRSNKLVDITAPKNPPTKQNHQQGPKEMKNTTSELKNTVQGIKSRLDEADIESVSWRTK